MRFSHTTNEGNPKPERRRHRHRVNMRPPPVQRMMMSRLLAIACLAMGGLASTPREMSVVNEGFVTEEACPPCELLFRNLERSGSDGKLTQTVKVQERGEPKSGTGMVFDWATGSLIRTCDYLKHFFGQSSCRVDLDHAADAQGPPLDRLAERKMVFDPSLGGSDARCSCQTVSRVSIILSRDDKHALPVSSSCAYSHNHGIEFARVHAGLDACNFPDGTPVTNHADLWRCMHEAKCDITDDWLQMVVYRDPRPAVVSAYYHLRLHRNENIGTVEEFVARELPTMCQWLAIRDILFSGLLPHQSVQFWYDDVMADPVAWHYDWFDAIGLQLPFRIVEAIAKAASANEFNFPHKKIDTRPGEEAKTETSGRRFEDQVAPELLEVADAVLRVWLPPVLLEKLKIAP